MVDLIKIHEVYHKDSEDSLKAVFSVNFTNNVFKGHFPDLPILPGVFQVQLIEYFAKKTTNNVICLDEIIYAKFINKIRKTNLMDKYYVSINITSTNTRLDCKASISNEDSSTLFMTCCISLKQITQNL